MPTKISEEKKAEIKKVWQEHRDLKLREVFDEHLKDIVDTSDINNWYLFMTFHRDWASEEESEKLEEELKTLTPEDVLKIQEKNRLRMVLLLRNILTSYETNPKKFKNIKISEVRHLYNTIQSLEELIKRTRIQKGKLKLEAVRTFLPYQRMSLPEILSLKEKLNESFDRIVKLKSGESAGPAAPVSG